jgi:hypothetical protein
MEQAIALANCIYKSEYILRFTMFEICHNNKFVNKIVI